MTKLSRRKYADLIRFLRSVIKNESISLRVRMQAAERLDGIYSRHEAPELKRLEREARAGDKPDTTTGAPGSDADVPAEPTPTESAQERARKFLESLSVAKEEPIDG